jgi:hypothetical protein
MAISEVTVHPIKVEHLLWVVQGPPASLNTLVLLVALATTILILHRPRSSRFKLRAVVELDGIACT